MSVNDIKGKEVASISDAIDAVRLINETVGPRYLYRGQGNAAWAVNPGILRPDYAGILENEKAATRDLISVQPTEFSSDQGMFDRLVRMQHFGMPTRLLDVTSNPLVGLYFACSDQSTKGVPGMLHAFQVPEHRVKYYDSDAVSCVANLANLSSEEKDGLLALSHEDRLEFNKDHVVDRLLQFIRMEKPHFRPEINPVDLFRTAYVVPKQTNRRIIAQSGSFLIFGLDRKAGPAYKKDIQSVGMVISADAKPKIVSELDRLAVNPSTLFPEIESAAAYIKARYV